MDHGIDPADPFGAAALFVCQSMAQRFDCAELVDGLLVELLALTPPRTPVEPVIEVLEPIDRFIDRIESSPGAIELVTVLAELCPSTAALTDRAQRLFEAVLWVSARAGVPGWYDLVQEVVRATTPGSHLQAKDWPRHGFFSAVLVLVYLGGAPARSELRELANAAAELGYHDLAPVLDWYLDNDHRPPVRP